MQENRLFKLLYYLVEHGKTSAAQLAEKMEVSVRTIYRDIDVLSSVGVPIYVTIGRNGGVQIADEFIIDRMMLSDREKEDILSALQSFAKIEHDKTATLSKLSAMFTSKSDSWLEVDLSTWEKETHDDQKFMQFKQSIINKNKMKITYANNKGEIKERIICPLKLVYKASNWYVKAYCEHQAAYRIFKLSRIIQFTILDRHFVSMNYPEELVNNPKSEYEEVILVFSADMAFRVYDEFAIDKIKNDEDGNLIVKTWMPKEGWTISYLLSFGAKVKVLYPRYLKQALFNEANKICTFYKTMT
ncbi:MAG: YafY family transcriptional regulator [Erysipelotrichaceae bacterium]|nr:YafY family transcriptional regulator [Erysipelotrichaceae bacterium]MDY5251936.1 YafY family protein [Erysipelotrichaceae bacterium]